MIAVDIGRDLGFEATASRYQDTGDEEGSGGKARIRVADKMMRRKVVR